MPCSSKREDGYAVIFIVEDGSGAFDNEYMLKDAGEVVATVDSHADALGDRAEALISFS